MDFASLLAKEIEKSKSASSNTSGKYITRRETEENREAVYVSEQIALEKERQKKAEARRKHQEEVAEEAREREQKRRRLTEESRQRREEEQAEEEKARRKRLGLTEEPRCSEKGQENEFQDADEDEDDEAADIPDEQLTQKLRELGHPIDLPGETYTERLARYRKVKPAVATGPIFTTIKAIEEDKMKVSGFVPKPSDRPGRKLLYRQLTSYFNLVLREWEITLQEESDLRTPAGRKAFEGMQQSKDTMKPVRKAYYKL